MVSKNLKKRVVSDNSGYTLVEILLSLALATAIFGCLSAMLLSQSKIVTEINTIENAKIYGTQVMNYVKDRLINAKELELIENSEDVTTGKDERVLYSKDGFVFDNNIQILGGMGNNYITNYYVTLENVEDTNMGKTRPVVNIKVDIVTKQEGNLVYTLTSRFVFNTYDCRNKLFTSDDYDDKEEVGTEVKNPRILYTVLNQYNVFED